MELIVLKASTEQDFDAMFTAVREKQAPADLSSAPIPTSPTAASSLPRSRSNTVAAITQSRDFPIAGGLMSYGGDFSQSHRQAGRHAGRILKGEKPSDLPVQRVTKVELFINLKAAVAPRHHRSRPRC